MTTMRERSELAAEERKEIKEAIAASRAEARADMKDHIIENRTEHALLHTRISSQGKMMIGWMMAAMATGLTIGTGINAYLLVNFPPWKPR